MQDLILAMVVIQGVISVELLIVISLQILQLRK